MRKRQVSAALAVIVAGVLLSGCSPVSSLATGATPAPPSATPSPTPVVAVALVLSLDDITVVNSDGSTADAAAFSDGAATVALLSRELGTPPTTTRNDDYGLTMYDWKGVGATLTDHDAGATVGFTRSELNGLALRTSEGIHVGSSLSEVRAVASPDTEYEPENSSDAYFGLEARPHPGTESLAVPGQVGKDYISVRLEHGIVVNIGTPGGDWQDL
jgi:hypothetical protein